MFTWGGSTISGSGTVTATAGLTINATVNLSGRTVTLSGGTGTLTGQIGVIMASGAVFNNNGTFDLSNDGGFASLSSFSGSGTFNNNGRFCARRRRAIPGGHNIVVPFINTGPVQVLAATLSLSGSGNTSSSASAYSVSSGATLTFNSNNSLPAGSSVSGAGTVRFTAGTVGVAGSLQRHGRDANCSHRDDQLHRAADQRRRDDDLGYRELLDRRDGGSDDVDRVGGHVGRVRQRDGRRGCSRGAPPRLAAAAR